MTDRTFGLTSGTIANRADVNGRADARLGSRPLATLAVCGLVLLLGVYWGYLMTRDTISPEIGFAYVWISRVQSFGEAVSKFLSFHEIWYRPLTQYVENYLLLNIVDFHNTPVLISLSFCGIILNSLVATCLARRLFGSGLIESILVFVLIATHPLNYDIAYEGSGTVDPVFIIFMNLFVILYIRLLEYAAAQPGLPAQQNAVRSGFVYLLCGALIVGCITSQERGLTIFPIIGLLYLFFQGPLAWRKPRRLNVPATVVFVSAVIIGLCYVVFVYASTQPWRGGIYRSDLELNYVLPNLIRAFDLPLRLLLSPSETYYAPHYNLEFNSFAVPFVACLIAYISYVLLRGNAAERRGLTIVAILYLCSLPIPVLFGAAPRHFFAAGMYLSIAMGRAVWFWLRRTGTLVAGGVLIATFAWLSVQTVRGLDEELQQGSTGSWMELVPHALRDKTLNAVPYKPEVVYYDTGTYGEFVWPFGGQGNLFKYLYKDRNLVEIALVHGEVLKRDLPLCSQVAGKRALAFAFHSDTLSWSAIGADPCPR